MEKSKDFLLEIGTEEFPATYIEPALSEIKRLMEEKLKEKGIEYSNFVVCGTPRRLVLRGEKVSCKGKERFLEINGPSKDRAFDENNVPTGIAIGFAKKQGVRIEELLVKNTKKGEYVYIKKKQPQEDTKKALAEIVPWIITSLNFPKTMRWVTGSNFHFARPIRLLLCLYGNKVVKFTFQDIKSGNYTYGLYALSRQKVIVSLAEKYKEILRNNYVIVDMEERRKIINQAITQVTGKTGGRVLKDDTLIEEINFLLEYPTAVLGEFSEKYLNLPREVLITCMRHHQKYFSVINREGKLLPYFVALRNGTSEYLEVLREGLEKVLVARFQDAEFYFKQDTGSSLEEKVEKLKKVVYHKELGSLYEKVKRVIEVSEFISRKMDGLDFRLPIVKRIAFLSKADLVTEMVKEFPELEGVMGKIYAAHSGEEDIVSEGIKEHYLPQSMEDSLPQTIETLIVSIADKMD
ncbi:glycine--tRNA ligase subunit beta, partial [bacterium]|nr:glycine--tRNA ligase subunit beta [bacterium]